MATYGLTIFVLVGAEVSVQVAADALARDRREVAPVVREFAERAGQTEELFEPHQPQLQTRRGLDVPRQQRVEVARLALQRFERLARAGQRVVEVFAARQALKLLQVDGDEFGGTPAHLLGGEALFAQSLRDDLQVGHPRHAHLFQTPRRPEDPQQHRRRVLAEHAAPARPQ